MRLFLDVYNDEREKMDFEGTKHQLITLGIFYWIGKATYKYAIYDTSNLTPGLFGEIIAEIFLWTGIPAVISFLCASKCFDWAIEKEKNKYIAFIIGFFLSLPGLFFYWLYYSYSKK